MKKMIFSILLILFSKQLQAQNNKLQSYTPSQLIKKQEWELKSFFNIYTQNKRFGPTNFSKNKIHDGHQTYITSINQLSYGLTQSINVGLDVWVKHVNYQNSTLLPRTAITGFGPKVKVSPFKKYKNLSIQSALLFPLADALEASYIKENGPYPFLEADKRLWLTQVYYDYKINEYWLLFIQQAFWFNIVRDSFRERNFLQTQSSLFVSYFPTDRATIYMMSEYFPTHYDDQTQQLAFFHQYFIQSGLGLKFQLITNVLELEGLYTNFWAGSEGQGAGQTFNLGLRYIH